MLVRINENRIRSGQAGIPIGVAGDHLTLTVTFGMKRYINEHSQGAVDLYTCGCLLITSRRNSALPLALRIEGGELMADWPVDRIDTALPGAQEIQLKFIRASDGAVMHTVIGSAWVAPSLEMPPDPADPVGLTTLESHEARIGALEHQGIEVWRPSVDGDGVISWQREAAQQPPALADIRGPAGRDGEDGMTPDVQVGAVTTLENQMPAAVVRRSGSPDEAPVFDFWLPMGLTGPIGPTGPAGPIGQTGPMGPAPSVQVGTVTTLDTGQAASVIRRADSPDSAPVLDFGLPRGLTGAQGAAGPMGPAPSIQIGTVVALDTGQASVARRPGSPDSAPVFDFGLPRGLPGPKGDPSSVNGKIGPSIELTVQDVGAETPDGAQQKVDQHAGDVAVHVDDAKRSRWNGVSNPNLLINGDFKVWQRKSGAMGELYGSGYTADRWRVRSLNYPEDTTVRYHAQGMAISLVYADEVTLYYRMEAQEMDRLHGKTVTLSYSVDGNITTGTYTFVKNTAPGSNTLSVSVQGEDEATVVVNWIKLELGEHATPFTPRTYARELADCQRYFFRTPGNVGLCAFAAGNMLLRSNVYAWPVQMRVSPSVSIAYNSSEDRAFVQYATGGAGAQRVVSVASNNRGCELSYQTAASDVAGNMYCVIAADAEMYS